MVLSEEIKELRTAGKLDEALQMASQSLKEEPENVQYKLNIAWIYYDYLRKIPQPDTFDAFKEYLVKIKNLQLPEEEKGVFDSCAWKIGKLIFAMHKEQKVNHDKTDELFELIKNCHFTKPSEAYSFLYRAFHKGCRTWPRYLEFADWWNFENFRAEDYLKEEHHGKMRTSIAEQAYTAYSQNLLEGKQTDKEKIQSFLPRLDKIIHKHPEYRYLLFFKIRLLLAIGSNENLLSIFSPHAKQMRNNFWTWELMAKISPQDKDTQFVCYCKALTLKIPETSIIKIRGIFAGMLVDRDMHNEAKTEIIKILNTCSKNEWESPYHIDQWTKQDWYEKATANKDNFALYLQHASRAEEILLQDTPEEIIAVGFVNGNKNMLNFVKDKYKYGFFNYRGRLDTPQVGDILQVRFDGKGKNGFFKIVTAKKAETYLTSEAIKDFEGTLNLNASLNFGFVEGIFVETKLIQSHNLTNGQDVKGKAILSFNKKKKEWGWKAIIVEM